MIRALLALFLVATAALVVVNRSTMGGTVPVMVAAGAVVLLVVAPVVWEGAITSRALRSVQDERRASSDRPVSTGESASPLPAASASARTGKRSWTAPRPSIWTQTPQPRDWFAHRAPRLARWQ